MPKFLTITPNEGESDEEFAKRFAEQASTHFGSAAPAEEPAVEPSPAVEPEAPTTDAPVEEESTPAEE